MCILGNKMHLGSLHGFYQTGSGGNMQGNQWGRMGILFLLFYFISYEHTIKEKHKNISFTTFPTVHTAIVHGAELLFWGLCSDPQRRTMLQQVYCKKNFCTQTMISHLSQHISSTVSVPLHKLFMDRKYNKVCRTDDHRSVILSSWSLI